MFYWWYFTTREEGRRIEGRKVANIYLRPPLDDVLLLGTRSSFRVHSRDATAESTRATHFWLLWQHSRTMRRAPS